MLVQFYLYYAGSCCGRVHFIQQRKQFYLSRILLLLLTSDLIKSHCDIFSCNRVYEKYNSSEISLNPAYELLSALFLCRHSLVLSLSLFRALTSIISKEKNKICNWLGNEKGDLILKNLKPEHSLKLVSCGELTLIFLINFLFT